MSTLPRRGLDIDHEVLIEEIRWLFTFGKSVERVALDMGLNIETLEQIMRREKITP